MPINAYITETVTDKTKYPTSTLFPLLVEKQQNNTASRRDWTASPFSRDFPSMKAVRKYLSNDR